MVFDQGSHAFHPITIVAIQNAIYVTHLGTVDMAAHNPLVTTLLRLARHGTLKISHVIQGTFDFMLEKRRQRPVGQAQLGTPVVQVAVKPQGELV